LVVLLSAYRRRSGSSCLLLAGLLFAAAAAARRSHGLEALRWAIVLGISAVMNPWRYASRIQVWPRRLRQRLDLAGRLFEQNAICNPKCIGAQGLTACPSHLTPGVA